MNAEELNHQMNDQESAATSDVASTVEVPSEEFAYVEPAKPKIGSGTLIMGGVLMIGAAAVWFMYQRAGGPKPAAAAVQETKLATKTISSFLDSNGAAIRNTVAMQRDTEKVVASFQNYPSMTQVSLNDLRTNPFRWKIPAAAPSTQPVDDSIGERRRREEERANMLKSVQGLQLQSIMCSDTRRACMINNTLFREGQQVESFNVEKITTTSVIVKNGSYRFELKMK